MVASSTIYAEYKDRGRTQAKSQSVFSALWGRVHRIQFMFPLLEVKKFKEVGNPIEFSQ